MISTEFSETATDARAPRLAWTDVKTQIRLGGKLAFHRADAVLTTGSWAASPRRGSLT